jgi:hypothetical protein
LRGRLLVFWGLDMEAVKQSILAEEVSGKYYGGPVDYACLTADS